MAASTGRVTVGDLAGDISADSHQEGGFMKPGVFNRYRVEPLSKVSLEKLDPADTRAFAGGKGQADRTRAKLTRKLDALQELLYAEHRHRVLVVLQGMDTAGKDGAIRHVFEGVNPQGVKVFGFKAPTAEELDHDFLWRVHKCVPGRGELAVFNRSHYEDVLIVRVHGLVAPQIWKTRYEGINGFERMLHREGVTILKFFLHISKDEQKKRLQARLDDRTKHWKFKSSDLPERRLWSHYEKAYEDVLSRTSTRHAPWFIVPSDKKWYRNLVVAALLVGALENLDMKYPKGDFDPKTIVIE
jgi:PPK2 family polyphosphate:nucleotide phosphotransferase